MELLQELFLTALLALSFSFLIAKIVSAASAGSDSHVSNSQTVDDWEVVGESKQDLQYRERLQVEKFESEKRAEFVEQGAQLADKFFEGPLEIEEVEKSVEKNEVIGVECREFPPQSTGDVPKEDKKLLEDISGNNGEEFQVNVKLADDSSSFQETEKVADDLLAENTKTKTKTEISPEKVVTEKSEENRTVESEAKEKADEKKTEIDSDDDDWEGIEKSELENIFAKATKFLESGDKDEDLTSAGSDLQMQLYGLHKVATEGPCRKQPPMALKVAARAKCDGGHWLHCARNAWQRLGNMSPDVAMEQYIALVSDKVPGWMKDKSMGDGKLGSSEAANIGSVASDVSTSSSYDPNPNITEERNADVMPSTEKNDWTGGSILESRAKE